MNFPCGPVAKTLCSQCSGVGSIPGQGTRSHMPQGRLILKQIIFLLKRSLLHYDNEKFILTSNVNFYED